MKAKLNKKKVIICIIVLLILIALPTFGRYIYNNVRDLYLKSQNFSFTSNLLTIYGKTYKYSNWSGENNYEIDFQLYSYENELSLFTYEGNGLTYSLTCTVDDETKASAHIETVTGASTKTSYISNTTNIKDIKIYLIPTENLEVGDIVKVKVTASTTSPYSKTLSATFEIVVSEDGVSYSIDDDANSIYATLELVNTKDEKNTITVSFSPSIVVVDATDECYKNSTSQTTTTIEEYGENVEYVNSFTFEMNALDSKNIRFYKKDISADYTCPGSESMVISVTGTN